ncbi:hypothetical protein TrVFT333_003522 [Trichoderma virens FT-333]|nr:hypothetical protein TrVFT333_003522 [Trichoderma virens FT-333]
MQYSPQPTTGISSSRLTYGDQGTSIQDLWNSAYDTLQEEDGNLIKKYEAKLRGNLVAGLGSTMGQVLSRRDWMYAILKCKMDEVEKSRWKLKYGESEVVLSDIAQSISKVINSANQFITAAVSSNPSASLAWAGVSVLLPLFSNPEKQAESLAKGLEYISSLIVQSQLRDDIYSRYYESEGSKEQMPAVFHRNYKDSLQAVYKHVLRFLATSYCYYDHKTAIRLGSGIFKRYDWKGLMDEIYEKEREFGKISDIWHDERYNQERSAAESHRREFMGSWRSLGEEMSSLRKTTEDDITRRKRKELLQWLSDINPSAQHNAALERHEDGTSRWLLQDDTKFKSWVISPKSILWLHGKAGSGKSILSSSVISHLQEEHKFDPFIAVAYFYFSFSDAKKQKKDEMLASLIRQICCYHPNLPEATIQLDILKDKQLRPDFKTLERVLIGVMKELPAVYIVIDAMDECPTADNERSKLMKSLGNIIRDADDNLETLRELYSPRDIRNTLQDLPEGLDDTYERMLQNIDPRFQKNILNSLKWLCFSIWPLTLNRLAEIFILQPDEAIVINEDDRFSDTNDVLKYFSGLVLMEGIYVRLAHFSIKEYLTSGRVVSSIFVFDEIDAHILIGRSCVAYLLYVSAMSSVVKEYMIINSQHSGNETHPTYQLLLYAASNWPAHLEMVPLSKWPPALMDKAMHALTTKSPSLYMMLRVRSIMAQPHFDHMLLQPYRYTASYGFLKLTKLLVSQEYCKYSKYLIQEDLNVALMDTEKEVKKEVMQFVLGKSACMGTKSDDKGWTDVQRHGWRSALQAAAGNNNLDIFKLLVNHNTAVKDDTGCTLPQALFGTNDGGCFEFLLAKATDVNWQDHTDRFQSALYQAACGGESEKDVLLRMRRLLDLGADPNLECIIGTPLRVACDSGYSAERVELLLEYGADVNLATTVRGTALQGCTERGRISLAKLLLKNGANVNSQGGKYGSALQAACVRRNNLEVIQLLLSHGAAVNLQGGKYGSALQAACSQQDNLEIIQLLLGRGADVNSQGGKHGSALQAACSRGGKYEIIQLLLEHGADVNMQGGEYGSALQVACSQKGNLKTIQLLLEYGANVNISGGSGNALQIACCLRGNSEVIQLLLKHGASVNLQGREYSNALQAACHNGATLDVVQLLLQHGADVNANGKHGNALQAACSAVAALDVIQLLLDSGADVNANGKIGTALQIACDRMGTLDIIQLLLDSGADVNAEGGKYGSALQAAAFQGFPLKDKVNLLLDHGANVNIDGTLQLICRWGESLMDVVRLLLDRKEGIDLTGAWHAAIECTYTKTNDLLQLLLDHGADINSVSGVCGTALHTALSWEWSSKIQKDDCQKSLWIARVRFLLQHGADINQVGGKYGFPLQSVCASEITYSEDTSGYFGDERVAEHYLQNTAVTEVVTLLLTEHPDIEVNAHGGVFGTALQAAAYSGQSRSIELLLKHGANATCCGHRCGKYRTGLNSAVIRGHWDIAEMLLEAGATPDCHFLWKPDEQFMIQIREEHSKSAEARYLRFWEVQKSLYKGKLLAERGRIALGYHLTRLCLLFYLQLLCSFIITTMGRWAKKLGR